MLGSEFYKNTRLELFVSPVFIPEPDGRLIYANRAFRSFVKKRVIEDTYRPDMRDLENDENGDSVRRIEVCAGSRKRVFDALKARAFNEYAMICFDDSIRNESFPIIENDLIFIKLKTYRSSLLIPLFGGRIRKIDSNDSGINMSAVSEPSAAVSDLEIRCICIEPVLSDIVRNFKERVAAGGYRIDADLRTNGSPICNLSIFDISIITELILL